MKVSEILFLCTLSQQQKQGVNPETARNENTGNKGSSREERRRELPGW